MKLWRHLFQSSDSSSESRHEGDAQRAAAQGLFAAQPRIMAQFLKSVRVFPEMMIKRRSKLDEMLSVMRQFFDGFMHIGQRSVFLLFLETVEHFRLPAFGEFFEGADI
jgi:hypothetical protein